jgi:hypothetical protein
LSKLLNFGIAQVFEAFGILAFSFTNPLLPEVRCQPDIHSSDADRCCCIPAVTRLVFWLLRHYTASCAVGLQIQSVTKPPAVQNGKKGVTAAFGSAFILYPLIAISGFWYEPLHIGPSLRTLVQSMPA